MKKKRFLKKRAIDQIPEFSEMPEFEKKFEELKKLCSEVKKLEQKHPDTISCPKCDAEQKSPCYSFSEQTAQSLKNYIQIRLVGIVENELKGAAAFIIDEFDIRPYTERANELEDWNW